VHTVLVLSSLLLAVAGGHTALALLRRRGPWTGPSGWSYWSHRRNLQLSILAAPAVSLGAGLWSLHHFSGRICFVGAPTWDQALGLALPALMGIVACAALGLGIARLALLYRIMPCVAVPAGPELRSLAGRIAHQLGLPEPRVLVCPHGRPLALTWGLCRPTLLLSAWMVERLDARELEAVVAHELGHAARRDYMAIWVATVLRDAFFYLPASWVAFRQLQREREFACDDLAVAVTRRPLALASALTKVWQHVLTWPLPAAGRPQSAPAVQGLLEAGAPTQSIERRIERLLAGSRLATPAVLLGTGRSRVLGLGLSTSALAGLLTAEAMNVAVLLAPMGCGPASLLRLLLRI
jgi:Zn-dependent protease with chaperone function